MKKRTGDELDLIESSLRAVAGTAVSTTLYVSSGIVYTAATSPEVAGKALFVVLVVILALRPVRGLSQTLHKVGSENNQTVSAYLSICTLFAAVYVVLLGIGGFLSVGVLSKYTIFEPRLLMPAFLLAVAKLPDYITQGLLGATGRPGYTTWVTATRDLLILSLLVLLMPLITTAEELLTLFSLVRIVLFPPVLVHIGVSPSMPTQEEISRAYEYAKWSIPDQIADILSYNMPTLVLGVVATPFAVAVYESADRFADFGAIVCYQLAGVLLTKVSGDWSAINTELDYLDSAVTGATGITFVVVGYLIPSRRVISTIAFPEAPSVFSVIVIIVGIVNIMRGFWTVVSFVMEGVNQPHVSFKSKLYALGLSFLPMVLLGREFGAIGGAAGYGMLNLTIFLYVVWLSYDHFDRVLVSWNLLAPLVVSVIPTVLAAQLVLAVFNPIAESVSLSVIGVITSVVTYAVCMYLASPKARHILQRGYQFYLSGRNRRPD